MKHLLVALSVAVAAVSLGLAPGDADAKRLGGGKAAGMQRQAPPPSSTPTNTPRAIFSDEINLIGEFLLLGFGNQTKLPVADIIHI